MGYVMNKFIFDDFAGLYVNIMISKLKKNSQRFVEDFWSVNIIIVISDHHIQISELFIDNKIFLENAKCKQFSIF